jgi:regulatory subunit for Cdc7p protein kinase
MATAPRRPLTHRPSSIQKRSRSPDAEEKTESSSKRVCTTFIVGETAANEKPSRQAVRERKFTEKEQQKAEFRDKYRRAFPSWTFYFDLDHIEPDRTVVSSFESRIQELGGVSEYYVHVNIHLTFVALINRPLRIFFRIK